MQQYKCKECGNKFESNDGINSFCPNCGSYEVVATSNIKKISGLIAAGLCAAALGFGVTGLFQNEDVMDESGGGGGASGAPTESNAGEATQSATDSNKHDFDFDDEKGNSDSRDNMAKNDEEKQISQSSSMSLNCSSPKAGSNGTYSFVASAHGVPKGASVSYDLLNSNGGLIVSSKTGRFVGVKPSSSGHLMVRATARLKGKVVATATNYVYGVGKIDKDQASEKEEKQSDSRKLSSSEVNSLFKTGALRNASTHPLIAPNVSVSCSGLKPGDSASSIADVYYIQKLRKADASVVGVGYDSKNKVNSIRFQVTYHSDDD